MIALQILSTFFVLIICTVAIIKGAYAVVRKFTYMDTNYAKLNKLRLQAYSQLNQALSESSISLSQSEKIYHNLFCSADDYFRYRKSLSLSTEKSFWFSDDTAVCLNEYIKVLDNTSIVYGLTKESDDALFMTFGTDNYQLFELYQTKLLQAISVDNGIENDVITFLETKSPKLWSTPSTDQTLQNKHVGN